MPRYTTSPQDIVDRFPYRNVHDLPTEILGMIFTMLNKTWLQPSGMPSVLAVSRTCRRWRQISLSLPSLWSCIDIRLRELDPSNYRPIALLTHLFVERSQKRPLRLILEFDEILSLDGKEDTVIPILRTLVQHSERWHTIEFYSITRIVMLHQVFSPISGRLPMLVDLTLFLEDKEENMPLDISCDLFSNCPSLTGLSWGPGFGPSTNQHLLAWGQIRMLHLYFTDIFDSLRGVTLGANIERLGLYHCSGESTSPLPLPGVTKLSITATLTDEAYCPFKYLTLRRLSSLDISRGPRYNVGYYAGGEIWKDWDETPIRDFFDRSGCTLTLLSLRGVLISDEQLIQLLRLMPALSSLRLQEFFGDQDVITNRTVTRRFLQKLTVDNTSSPLLPKLTEIFLVLHEDGLADTVLPDALISRWVPDSSQVEVACIKSVAVVFANESEETIEGLTLRLRSLKERGVWVSVGSVEVVTVDVEDAEDAEDVEDEAS